MTWNSDIPGYEGMQVYEGPEFIFDETHPTLVDIQLLDGVYLMVEFEDGMQVFFDLRKTRVSFFHPKVDEKLNESDTAYGL